MFVVKKLATGGCDYDIAANFNVFFPQERLLLLRAVKEGKLQVNMPLLLNKLTPEEKRFLTGSKAKRTK